LRQAIGTWNGAEPRDYVRQDSDQLFLDPTAPIWIDTDVFIAHIQAAEGLASEGRRSEAAREYAHADEIYRDDFLVEDALEQWSLVRREELKDRYQVVLARLADYFIESGDLMACISSCHKLLSQDSCREDAYLRLMYCHTALGQRSRAVRWYRVCETTLIADLGMGPGERTRSLYERIVSDASWLPSIDWLIGSRRDLRVGPAI
jgi:DNA-binding SARP family transcriptional activator